MALGDNYNNNKKNYSPSVYSQYKFNNIESAIDKTTLAPSFWNSMLKISIAPMKGNDPNNVEFDYDNGINIYLNHTKARMLYQEICKFQENPEQFNNVGVPSGAGLITITNGKEFGKNATCIVIRKLNSETGAVESSFAYEFKSDYHYSIRNFDESNNGFDKVYYNELELEQFKMLLTSYYESMTGAVAYSVIDNMKYDMSRINTKLNSVAEKLGVSYGKGNKGTGGNNSYFNQANGNNQSNNTSNSGSSYSAATYDDIMSQME